MSLQLILGDVVFPLTPETIAVTSDAVVQSINLLDQGIVAFPRGFQPTKIKFDGILPGEDRAGLAIVDAWEDPIILSTILDTYRREGSTINFTIADTPLNLDVFVDSYAWKISGGFGDISFSLSLTEKRSIIVMTQTSAGAIPSRPGLPTLPSSYTTRVGQTFMIIAQLVYGDSSLWDTLRQANLDQFASDPGPGGPLAPGTVLRIPGGGGA